MKSATNFLTGTITSMCRNNQSSSYEESLGAASNGSARKLITSGALAPSRPVSVVRRMPIAFKYSFDGSAELSDAIYMRLINSEPVLQGSCPETTSGFSRSWARQGSVHQELQPTP
ncbi:hypothetical protein LF1_40780 [Rubripirellula obstinata]|uniref:Uncharacterized protein n=1 Tax=Rubripirellula obstinata TaxID=406547 RepID=A0A5B1CKE9_9BACT|nr:hypothetical protein LF1_40780 [Rubripirellula obstinata]